MKLAFNNPPTKLHNDLVWNISDVYEFWYYNFWLLWWVFIEICDNLIWPDLIELSFFENVSELLTLLMKLLMVLMVNCQWNDYWLISRYDFRFSVYFSSMSCISELNKNYVDLFSREKKLLRYSLIQIALIFS